MGASGRSRGESGQSFIEFLLMLPVMVALTVLMIRVNMAIQMSIVDQQYGRAQTHYLTVNYNQFPRQALRHDVMKTRGGYNQMVIGVSDNAPAGGGSAEYNPQASVFSIVRNGGGSDTPKEEPPSRSKVRIRDTVTLCTQSTVFADGSPIDPFDTNGSPSENGGFYSYSETSKFSYCRSPMPYE